MFTRTLCVFALIVCTLLPLGAADTLLITEFMAANGSTLADEDGTYPDWVEIYNPGTNTVSLNGWHLTDSAANLTKWQFPATNIAPRAFVVVFASGKDRRVPGAPLHTSFALSTGGEYLALVEPNGTTVAFAYSPVFPPQVTDVSFGLDNGLRGTTLLPTNAIGKFFVPTNASLGTNWILPAFDDSSWRAATSSVGFVVGALDRIPVAGLTNALVSYWKFDETTGALAADASGRGNNGTLLNFPANASQWTAGKNEGSLRFRGSPGNDYVRVANYPKATNAISIAAWVFAEGRPTWASIAKNWFGSGGQFHFGLRENSGDLDIFVNTTSGQFSVREGTPIPLGQWQHVAFTADGATLRLFRNGAQVASIPYSGNFLTPAIPAMGIGVKLNDAGAAADTGSPGYWQGRIDDLAIWHRALAAGEVQAIATAGGAGGGPPVTDVRAAMLGVNASAYLRFPFVVESPATLTRWRLRMRYDDGFAAWINGEEIVRRNAPESLNWNSNATGERSMSEAAGFEEFNLAEFAGFMIAGTNVLAIQGLNLSANDTDFLVQPVIEASSVTNTTNAFVYFATPTPGAENVVGVSALGPIIRDAVHSPRVPLDLEDLLVTAKVSPSFAPVTNVTLRYRIMFSNEVAVRMFDDGAHGDGAAGDGIYGATIPAAASTNGQMIRYAISAADIRGVASRIPIFNDPTDADEYLGTVVQNPAINTALPVFHWFVAAPALAETATGTRCSVFYNGELYDNVFVRIRGGTSRSWPKKSYKVELNEDHEFELYPGEPRVTEFDWNTTYTDKSYLRSVLTYEHQRDAGLPSPITLLAHLRQNGAFYNVTVYSEQPDKDFLRRIGLDENGSFYKCGPGSTYDTVAPFEKKTRLAEGNADLQSLLASLGLTGSALEAFVFDNIDVPGMVNFMATVAITQNIDASDKNHFLYRDTEGTREWRMLPWDQDLTFGPDALNTDAIVYNLQNTNSPACASHPFIGARPYMLHAAKYNRLLEAIVKTPRAREMLLRRTRTLSDRFLATGYFQRRIDELVSMIGPDVALDKARWAASAAFPGTTYTLQHANDRIKTNYLAPRLTYLTGPTIVGVGSANPASQLPNAVVRVANVEFNPASGNQAQEYLCLTNESSSSLDVSAWRIEGAVQYTFKPGTVVPSNSVVYVSPDVVGFRTRTSGPRSGQGLFVVGPYQGNLSARGESIVVRDDTGRLVSSNSYVGSPSLAQQFLRITEVMYHPGPTNGGTFGREEFEYVELKNVGASAVNLVGVHFTNGIEFAFTAGSAVTSLGAGQVVVLVKNAAAFASRYGGGATIAGVYSNSLDNAGERLQLHDALGEEILDFSYNNAWYPITDGLGFSLVIVNENAPFNTWDEKASWRASGVLNGSGGQNDPAPPVFARVLVNEVLANSEAPVVDAIELWNTNGTPADISHWWISDDFFTPQKYRVPAGTMIPAGGYRVFTEAQFNPGGTNFSFSSGGDEAYLFSGDAAGNLTGYAHGFDFDASEPGVSLGRYLTSDGDEHWVAQKQITTNAANAGPRVGPIVISEIMYHPPDLVTGDDSDNEFIELHNISSNSVSLFDANYPTNRWRLDDAVEFSFSTNTTMAAGGFLVVVGFDPATNATALAAFRAKYGIGAGVAIVGPWSGQLDNSEDDVELKKPDTSVATNITSVLVEKVHYHDAGAWPGAADGFGPALIRIVEAGFGNDATNWLAGAPTPGAASTIAPPPVITTQPASATLLIGRATNFTVAATGGNLTFQWFHNGTAIPGASGATLNLANAQLTHAGTYNVVALSGGGAVLSSNATLTVLTPLAFIAQPNSQIVLPGTNVTIGSAAVGNGPLRYQWSFEGVPIPNATNASYSFTNASIPAHHGNFSVVAMDDFSTVLSSNARIFIRILPGIVQQPASVTNLQWQAAAFSVIATGAPPLNYRWLRQGVNFLSNAPATLVIPSLQPSNAGSFRVTITNLAGLVNSVTVTLGVIADTDADGLPDFWETNYVGNATNLSASADPDGDGMSNRDEYVAGTNPTNALSVLKLTLTTTNSGQLQFVAQTNIGYTLQYRTNLTSAAWSNLTSITAQSLMQTVQVNVPKPPPEPARFYRLVTPPVP